MEAGMEALVTLGRIADLPDGQARGFDPGRTGRDTLFVVRRGDALHGWLDRCPHEIVTPLPYRRHAYLDAAGARIVCSAHGAQFDVVSGECLAGPCLGEFLTPVPIGVSPGELRAQIAARTAATVFPGSNA
jgi:nitrite reductase/ring-hydroxylating ferredoxin subunit